MEESPIDFERVADEIRTKFAAAVSDGVRNISVEAIKQQVIARLNQQQDQIAMALLGLRSDFDRMEIDPHKNGVVAQHIQKHAEAAVGEWIQNNLNGAIKGFKLTPEKKQQLQKNARQQFDYAFRRAYENACTHYAAHAGEQLAREVINQAYEKMGLEPPEELPKKDRW